ncbi:MAG: PAS domain-containing sensor histidine kinase [Bacteroidia bacterium]|nr:PAS domain-containing sensor histidine kinase [Bacteroidia bacterium]
MSLVLIVLTAVTCYFLVGYIGYKVVALVLLLVVSVLAMLYDILPVLIAAVFSALTWNFFFIPPTFNFTIGSTEDALMFLMYFVVALINAVLTFKIRDFEKKARDKEEREKSIRLYNTLLSSLSHELRTPIATIIGSIDTIRENGSRISESSRHELYGEVAKASLRLNRQVDNLLNMSRLEAGFLSPKLDWCDLNELIHTVILHNQEVETGHAILFEANENLPLVRIDRGLMEQVLHNLVHNAVEHTPVHSTIRIEVEVADGMCRLRVSDNGPGFPEHEIPSVFNKFYRLPQSAAGGTGLGLSIARGFTEAHKGRIVLENLPAGGAKFTVEIPCEHSTLNPEK